METQDFAAALAPLRCFSRCRSDATHDGDVRRLLVFFSTRIALTWYPPPRRSSSAQPWSVPRSVSADVHFELGGGLAPEMLGQMRTG